MSIDPDELNSYFDLVFAANRLLAKLEADDTELPPEVAVALSRLRAALVGPSRAEPVPDGPIDPRSDLLHFRNWLIVPKGSRSAPPFPLDDAAAMWRQAVESGESPEAGLPDSRLKGGFTMHAGRSHAITQMLQELAERLAPGMEIGPMNTDGAASRLATDLVEDIRRRM